MLLVAVIALLDLARHITGRIEFGWPNMLLLYALAHQFGFCYRDGWLLNVRRRWLVLAAAGALIALRRSNDVAGVDDVDGRAAG